MNNNRKDEAIRWAKAGAILNPSIQFIAIMGDRMYCFEANMSGTERLKEITA